MKSLTLYQKKSIGFSLVFILAFAICIYFYIKSLYYVSTEDAYVNSHTLAVNAQVSGQIKKVLVKYNQRVKKGALLVQIDDEPYKIALLKAKAQLEAVETSINEKRASYKRATEQLSIIQEQIKLYSQDALHEQTLKKGNFVSAQTLNEFQQRLYASQVQEKALQDRIDSLKAFFMDDPTLKTEEHPLYKEARAMMEQAALNLSWTNVYAPMDGIIGDVSIVEGGYNRLGTNLFYLVLEDFWVDANFKETELCDIKPGQKATLVVDTYPNKTWVGIVDSISPASQSSFSLLPAQNTSGNWVKVTQRIPVRIKLNETLNPELPLRIGMSTTVTISITG